MDSEVRSGCLHLRGDITVRSLSLLLAARRIRGAGSLKHLALPAAARELAALYDIEDWIAE